MKFMMCTVGEPEVLPYLLQLRKMGAGIELGGFGLRGVRSEQEWQACLERHLGTKTQFSGPVAMHGPFVGIEYTHLDYLIREVAQHRLDMTYEAAQKLNVTRVILHAGYTPENDLFNLHDIWYRGSLDYWEREIRRWESAGIEIVLENVVEKSPDLLTRLVNEINNPYLGMCLDVGHGHMFSQLSAPEWVRRMGNKLWHIHLHDNDGTQDSHQALGRGTIDFPAFYDALYESVPEATISLEVEDLMDVKMDNLREVIGYFIPV